MAADNDSRPHVLCVNDTREILDLLRELLEGEGYRVTTSMVLLDLDKTKAVAPDVIVQDIMFEGNQEPGWKYLLLARLDPELARIPVVLCTGATNMVHDERMAAHLDRLGVRVVLKPFNIEDLLTALREVLAAQELIEQALDGAGLGGPSVSVAPIAASSRMRPSGSACPMSATWVVSARAAASMAASPSSSAPRSSSGRAEERCTARVRSWARPRMTVSGVFSSC
jgi:CheY-like chemotaxis protein